MGLLLSILVSCVGVVELIAFYFNLRRSLVVTNLRDTDLESIACTYRRLLTKEYRLILAEVNGRSFQPRSKTNFALCTSPKTIFSSVESRKKERKDALDYESSEEIQSNKAQLDSVPSLFANETATINILPNLSSMIHYKGIEKNQNESNHEPYFPASRKSKCAPQSAAVEFSGCCAENQKDTYLLKEPLIKDSGRYLEERNENNFEREKHISELTDSNGNVKNLILEEPVINQTSSDIEKLYLQEDMIDLFRRSPSPFPTYEKIAPRGSICSELLEDPFSVEEVEEDTSGFESEHQKQHACVDNALIHFQQASKTMYKSRSLSPNAKFGRSGSSFPIACTQLETDTKHVRRSVSPTIHSTEDVSSCFQQKREINELLPSNYHLVAEDYWRNCPSPFEQLLSEDNDVETSQRFVLVEEAFNEEFKNSLDGIKTNEDHKRDFKRKRHNRFRSSQSPLKDQNCTTNYRNIQNIALTESLLEFGVTTNEELSFSTNFLMSQYVLCQKTLSTCQIQDTNYENFDASSENAALKAVDISTDPKPGPSREEKKPEPFWVK
ncbi:hypothetical protein Trydic_g22793 [Trypoxylus dichotomus]